MLKLFIFLIVTLIAYTYLIIHTYVRLKKVNVHHMIVLESYFLLYWYYYEWKMDWLWITTFFLSFFLWIFNFLQGKNSHEYNSRYDWFQPLESYFIQFWFLEHAKSLPIGFSIPRVPKIEAPWIEGVNLKSCTTFLLYSLGENPPFRTIYLIKARVWTIILSANYWYRKGPVYHIRILIFFLSLWFLFIILCKLKCCLLLV